MRWSLGLGVVGAVAGMGWFLVSPPAVATSCGCIGEHFTLTLVETTCTDCPQVVEEGRMAKTEHGPFVELGDVTLYLEDDR